MLSLGKYLLQTEKNIKIANCQSQEDRNNKIKSVTEDMIINKTDISSNMSKVDKTAVLLLKSNDEEDTNENVHDDSQSTTDRP